MCCPLDIIEIPLVTYSKLASLKSCILFKILEQLFEKKYKHYYVTLYPLSSTDLKILLLQGVIGFPQSSYVEVLISSTSECDLI